MGFSCTALLFFTLTDACLHLRTPLNLVVHARSYLTRAVMRRVLLVPAQAWLIHASALSNAYMNTSELLEI
jgi:hypothetical protein